MRTLLKLIFLLENPLRPSGTYPLKPFGAPDFVKNPPFQPLEKLSKLKVQNLWVFQIANRPGVQQCQAQGLVFCP